MKMFTFLDFFSYTYSYIADITSDLERTSRLSVLDGTDYISTMLGTFIGAPLFKFFGYYAVFGCSGSLALLGVFYAATVVKESLPEKSVERRYIKQHTNSETTSYGTNIRSSDEADMIEDTSMVVITPSKENEVSNTQVYCTSQSSCCKSLPSLWDLASSFGVIVKERSGWNRAMVLM